MTGKRLAIIGLIVVLALAALAGCSGKSGATQQATNPAAPGQGAAIPAGAPAAAGTAAATQPAKVDKWAVPIEIVAYYPFNESHKFIADYLKSVEKANPGNIKVSVYDMQTEDGRKKWETSGLSCAGVFVNGSTTFDLMTNGKKETVAFLQRMDVYWTHQDFERVLTEILQKAGKKFVSPNYKPKAASTESKPAAQPGAKPSAAPK